MNENHNPTPTLDDDLRMMLLSVFAKGFLEAMIGGPVKGDDLIGAEDAALIETTGLACIEAGEELLAAHYRENPLTCCDAVYDTGRWAYSECERQYLQRN